MKTDVIYHSMTSMVGDAFEGYMEDNELRGKRGTDRVEEGEEERWKMTGLQEMIGQRHIDSSVRGRNADENQLLGTFKTVLLEKFERQIGSTLIDQKKKSERGHTTLP